MLIVDRPVIQRQRIDDKKKFKPNLKRRSDDSV